MIIIIHFNIDPHFLNKTKIINNQERTISDTLWDTICIIDHLNKNSRKKLKKNNHLGCFVM